MTRKAKYTHTRAEMVRVLRASPFSRRHPGNTFVLLKMAEDPKRWVPGRFYRSIKELIGFHMGPVFRQGLYDPAETLKRLVLIFGAECRFCGSWHRVILKDDDIDEELETALSGLSGTPRQSRICHDCLWKFRVFCQKKEIKATEDSGIFFLAHVARTQPKWAINGHRWGWYREEYPRWENVILREEVEARDKLYREEAKYALWCHIRAQKEGKTKNFQFDPVWEESKCFT